MRVGIASKLPGPAICVACMLGMNIENHCTVVPLEHQLHLPCISSRREQVDDGSNTSAIMECDLSQRWLSCGMVIAG